MVSCAVLCRRTKCSCITALHTEFRRPVKTTFLAGERVWVHSKKGRRASDGDFVKLWSPILANMGAHVVLDDDVPQTELELQQWLGSGSV